MKAWENQQIFDFVLNNERFLRASLTPNDDGSYSPGLSEIHKLNTADIHPLLSPIPCEKGSGHYEAFIQLLGAVQWKVVRTDALLESIMIKRGVDEDCKNTLERIISHFAPGVNLVRTEKKL
ncbi:hypothetical protein [Enterobacter asburiae]|uniref:hypothetical protein n=1 Tax=Enterobacter asburiae TaxID=61645 RepID=UPI001CBFEAEE|nr:hypothetical protein [Enterobacter asburiae]UAN38279.1 hypothetical protein KGP18_10310 [Enterobacter asburiae]